MLVALLRQPGEHGGANGEVGDPDHRSRIAGDYFAGRVRRRLASEVDRTKAHHIPARGRQCPGVAAGPRVPHDAAHAASMVEG